MNSTSELNFSAHHISSWLNLYSLGCRTRLNAYTQCDVVAWFQCFGSDFQVKRKKCSLGFLPQLLWGQQECPSGI